MCGCIDLWRKFFYSYLIGSPDTRLKIREYVPPVIAMTRGVLLFWQQQWESISNQFFANFCSSAVLWNLRTQRGTILQQYTWSLSTPEETAGADRAQRYGRRWRGCWEIDRWNIEKTGKSRFFKFQTVEYLNRESTDTHRPLYHWNRNKKYYNLVLYFISIALVEVE